MNRYFSAVLIPADAELVPGNDAIARFVAAGIDALALQAPQLQLHDWTSPRVSVVGEHALTRERIEMRAPERRDIVIGDIASITAADVDVVAYGTTRVSPVGELGTPSRGTWRAWTAGEPFELALKCCRRSRLCSTSDLHDETDADVTAIPFGEPCQLGDRMGLYSHPETLELLQIPGAGCAKSWIAIDLGKGMFPKATRDAVSPNLLALAERTFATTFTQVWFWA